MPGPGPQAHQVLVYSGPGVSPLSLSHTLLTLSLLLTPHYTVQPVNAELLATEPWEPSCALVVIPGGRDLPYVAELSSKTNVTRRIREYVAGGGRFLGFCAGAYFGGAEVRFDVGGEKEVVGKRDLALFPGVVEGPTYNNFDYASETGARAVTLLAGDKALDLLYYNGGGHMLMPTPAPAGVTVLARYAEPPRADANVAAVLVEKGSGRAVLTGVHPEYPLLERPARDAVAKAAGGAPDELVVEEAEKARLAWMTDLLTKLGLSIPDHHKPAAGSSTPAVEADHEEDAHLLLNPTHPSPVFALSHPSLPELSRDLISVPGIQAKLAAGDDGWSVLRDGNDEITFGAVDKFGDVPAHLAHLRRTKPAFPPAVENLALKDGEVPAAQPPDLHALPKTLLLPSPKEKYDPSWTPLFNFDTYWAELGKERQRQGRKSGVLRRDEMSSAGGERASIGDSMLYGEVVTSTQTMLDRNPVLLTNLRAPLAFLASFQMAGRGRGANLWLSPAGCLQFTLLLNVPSNMASKLVFVQYVAALAISEALDEDGRLGVRIKWPNDIYAEVAGVGGTEPGGSVKGRAKMGGILVNTNYVNGSWRVLVGCGVNILNALPTSSLGQLHSLLSARSSNGTSLPPPPTMEGSLARILEAFEHKWEKFIDDRGFHGFLDEYHSRWLHTDQEVTLTTVTPHQKLRIVGITPDHGLLRGVPLEPARAAPTTSSRGLTPLYSRDMGSGDDRYAAPMGFGNQQYVDLQPDGNSFDLMSGMIKKKT